MKCKRLLFNSFDVYRIRIRFQYDRFKAPENSGPTKNSSSDIKHGSSIYIRGTPLISGEELTETFPSRVKTQSWMVKLKKLSLAYGSRPLRTK